MVFNKRTRQKALLKKLTKEKYKEKISNEIDRYVGDFLMYRHDVHIKILFLTNLLFFLFCLFPSLIACPIS